MCFELALRLEKDATGIEGLRARDSNEYPFVLTSTDNRILDIVDLAFWHPDNFPDGQNGQLDNYSYVTTISVELARREELGEAAQQHLGIENAQHHLFAERGGQGGQA